MSTGYANGVGEHVLHVRQRNAAVCLHTVPAKAASSYAVSDMQMKSGSLLLADGSTAAPARHDAFTQAGKVPQEGMSGDSVLNIDCEFVGVARGGGAHNMQGLRACTCAAAAIQPALPSVAVLAARRYATHSLVAACGS